MRQRSQHALVQCPHRAIARHLEFDVLRGVALPAQHGLAARATQDDVARIAAPQGVGFVVIVRIEIAPRARRLHAIHGHGLRKFRFEIGLQLPFVLQLQSSARGHGDAADGRDFLQRDIAGCLGTGALSLDLPDHRLHPGIEGERHGQHDEHQGRSLPVLAHRTARAAAGDQDHGPGQQRQTGKKTQGNKNVEASRRQRYRNHGKDGTRQTIAPRPHGVQATKNRPKAVSCSSQTAYQRLSIGGTSRVTEPVNSWRGRPIL
jgi:hypothetical protein